MTLADVVDGSSEAFSPILPDANERGAGRPPSHAHAEGRSKLRLQLETDLLAVKDDWEAFESEADCTAFQTFRWASTWQRHVGSLRGTRPVIVTGRDPAGRILFIFPLAVERRSLARRLTWLGSDLCDYNGPVLSSHFGEQVGLEDFVSLWRDILALIQGNRRLRFDIVDLSKMPAKVGGQPNPFMALKPVPGASSAHLATLGKDWEAFYAARRSSGTRKRERRQFKNLAEFGEVRFVEPTERQDLEVTLDTLFAQKAASFARMGIQNFLLRPGYRAFFHAIATDQAADGLAHVSRLDVGPNMTATSFGLQFRGRYYLILSSYQEGELSRFGPGRAHLQELMRRAIREGMPVFDFTVGDEPYKRDWSDVSMPLYGHFGATTLRGVPAVIATRAFRAAKRQIKQNPVLWEAFSKARGRIARHGRAKAQPAGKPEASTPSD